MVNRKDPTEKTTRPRKLDEIKEELVELEADREWVALPLSMRAFRILREHRIDVDPHTLARWYKVNGFRRGIRRNRIASKYTDKQKLKLQKDFSMKLLRHWQRGDEILFFDECTCHSWLNTYDKTWFLPDKEHFMPIAPTKSQTVAV